MDSPPRPRHGGIHGLTRNDVAAALAGVSQNTSVHPIDPAAFLAHVHACVPRGTDARVAWRLLTSRGAPLGGDGNGSGVLRGVPFALHKLLYDATYEMYDEMVHGPAPVWFPRGPSANLERVFSSVVARMRGDEVARRARLCALLRRRQRARSVGGVVGVGATIATEIDDASEMVAVMHELSVDEPRLF